MKFLHAYDVVRNRLVSSEVMIHATQRDIPWHRQLPDRVNVKMAGQAPGYSESGQFSRSAVQQEQITQLANRRFVVG